VLEEVKMVNSEDLNPTIKCPECKHPTNLIFGSDGTWSMQVRMAITDYDEEVCCYNCRRIYSYLSAGIW
jgi:uncharacterized protein YbaR (Trm112 family)